MPHDEGRGRVFGFSKLAGARLTSRNTLSSRQFRKTKHPTPALRPIQPLREPLLQSVQFQKQRGEGTRKEPLQEVV